MFKKIEQYKKYKAAKKEAAKLAKDSDDLFVDCFINARSGVTTVVEQDWPAPLFRPWEHLFGTRYPCIVLKPSDEYLLFRKSGTAVYACKQYEENLPCKNINCRYYPENKAAADAYNAWQTATEKCKAAEQEYHNAARAFFGNWLYKQMYQE